MEGMIGEVRMFAGNFAPRTWAFCEGQLLPIAQNTALFSILGTIYGGDGRTTFALPDMRGRAVLGPGNGPGLSSYREGQKGGVENVILNTTQIPSHNHLATLTVENKPATALKGKDRLLGTADMNIFVDPDPATNNNMAGAAVVVGNTGGNLGHTNMQPWIAVYYIICLQGVFPSRS